MFPEIKITKTTNPRKKPEAGQPLPFGKNFSDHMFVMDYVNGRDGLILESFLMAHLRLNLQLWCSIMVRLFSRA